jgi:hypothetical protein
MAEWIPLLKRIKDAGKLVVGICEPDEVLPLVKELGPDGLLLSTSCGNEREARGLLESLSNSF